MTEEGVEPPLSRAPLALAEALQEGRRDGRRAAAVADAGQVGLDGVARARAHQPVYRSGVEAELVQAVLHVPDGRAVGEGGAAVGGEGGGVALAALDQIGRASCRERGCQYV